MKKKWIYAILICSGILISSAAFGYRTELVVAQDGSGDFTSIQGAIDASKSYPDERITIHVRDGVYEEKVKVHTWNTKLTLVGESSEETVIRYDDYFGKIDRGRNSTFFTYTLLVQGNDFHAENLTIENSAGPVGQAVALHVEADRSSFENCRFLGHQDTVFAAGEGARQYFKDCYIEGTTDFIFGEATAVFEECTIHSKRDSYITAASTDKRSDHGFLFKNCRLTAEEGVTEVYLGRPWRKNARTVFVNCYMGDHVRPAGWHNWGNEEAEASVYYAEYANEGPGYQPDERVEWAHILTKEEACAQHTRGVYLGDWKPWKAER